MNKTERFTGCLLAGAAGDAIGYSVEFKDLSRIQSEFGAEGITGPVSDEGPAKISDDTQMVLFTAEGVLRARTAKLCGNNLNVVDSIYRSYLRWLHCMGERARDEDRFGDLDDGWLVNIPRLREPRALGQTCISALRTGTMGSPSHRINDSKGCGGIMRAAPAGLAADSVEKAFELGVRLAATTHTHPSGYYSAGTLAATIFGIVHLGMSIRRALKDAGKLLAERRGSGECRRALEHAFKLSARRPPSSRVVSKSAH